MYKLQLNAWGQPGTQTTGKKKTRVIFERQNKLKLDLSLVPSVLTASHMPLHGLHSAMI
jgi:hypothetical protein